MKVRRLFNGLLLLLVFLSGCQNPPSGKSPVLVSVDGRTVSLAHFSRDFQRTLPGEQQLTAEQRQSLQRAYLAQVIDRELALAEADRLDVRVDAIEVEQQLTEMTDDYAPEEFERQLKEQGLDRRDWRQQLEEGLRIEKVIELAAYSGVRVTAGEIEAYYKKHKDEFDRPRQVRARQLVVADKETGERLLGLLRQGEKFADLARQYSLSPDAEQGGELGWFARGEMPPEFDAVVFELTPGRTSELVKSPYGFHLFQVEERRKAQRLTLKAASDRIRALLLHQAQQQAYRSWLANLRDRAVIEINLDLLTETVDN